ncbi:hypothetical protein Tco_0736179, partial [Tanacetum coccineum]
VDASIFPLVVPWHGNKSLKKDHSPLPTEYNPDVCDYLATNPAPFKKFPEPFLCLIGISRHYTLDESCYPTFWENEDEEMDLFAFIRHANPTKVKVGEREIQDREVPFLELTQDRVVPLAGVYERGDANVQDAGNDDAKEEAIVADQPKKIRKKRKTTDGASGLGLPPKKLRSDHVATGDAGDNVAGKSLAALQGLLDISTLAVKVGVTAAATVPFVTSSMTPTPEHEDGEGGDSVTGPIVRTRPAPKRFVVLKDSSHYSSTNAVDNEVTSVVRS